MGKRILVITGGEQTAERGELASGAPYDLVIAADSGLDRARFLGIRPDIVVGDLDSASPAAIDEARREGSEIETHPVEKDHTDFELALKRAIREGASEVGVIGGSGGRPDHWLANLSLLADTAQTGISVTAEMGGWRVCVVVPGQPYSEEVAAADVLSLLPIGGNASGVTTEGLLYPLRNEDLAAGSSRGVSNVARGGRARVDIQDGTLLVMRRQEPSPRAERNEAGR